MLDAVAMPRNRIMILVVLSLCIAVSAVSHEDSSIPKSLDETLPIHRAVKANDLVEQIYE